MAATATTLRIFISSPGDVEAERDKARGVIASLERRYPDTRLEPVLWEDLALEATASFQNSIDALLLRRPIDIAVFILWSRLGSPLGSDIRRPDGGAYRSGTEREFDLMLREFERSTNRRPVILAYARRDEDEFRQRLTTLPSDVLEEAIAQRKLADSFIREQFHDTEGRNLRAIQSYVKPTSFAQRLYVHLRQVLDDLLEVDGRPDWQGTPYRGLDCFDVAHERIFHGRDQETLEVLERLRRQRQAGCGFVVIVGASGSGKSSLARAGVAATLVHHAFEDGDQTWRQASITPSLAEGGPLRGLVTALTDALPEIAALPRDDVVAGLRDHPERTLRLVLQPAIMAASRRAAGVRLLLLLDQLEELWTDAALDPGEREAFLGAVGALARSGSVDVVATLRSDFYAQAQASAAFLRMKGDEGQFDLRPPGPAALRRLITEPARLAGLRFEVDEHGSRALDDVILEDAARDPASLPLVQYALAELYELRDAGNRRLTFAAYERLGGVEGALARRAEAVFEKLSAEARRALDEILPCLVTVNQDGDHTAVRRRSPWAELRTTAARRELTDALVSARFLTTDRQGDAAVASLAHEALLRRWPRIADWITANAAMLRARDRVEEAKRRWDESDRDASLLLAAGLPVEEGRRLLDHDAAGISADLADFVRRSITHHEAAATRSRRRTRAVIAALAGLALVATVGGLFAWKKEQDAAILVRQASENDLAAGIEIWRAYDAEALEGRMLAGIAGEPKYKEAMAYWIRALRFVPDNRPAAAWLFTALADTLQRQPFVPPPDVGFLTPCRIAATSADGTRSLAVPESDPRTLVAWDALTGAPLVPPLTLDSAVWSAAISPSGCFIATVAHGEPVADVEIASNDVTVWDADKELTRITRLRHDRPVHGMCFGPDDQTVLTLESAEAVDAAPPPPGQPPRGVARRIICWGVDSRGDAKIRWTQESPELDRLSAESVLFSDDKELVFAETESGVWLCRVLATGETRHQDPPLRRRTPTEQKEKPRADEWESWGRLRLLPPSMERGTRAVLTPGENGAVLAWEAGAGRPSRLLAGTGGSDVADIRCQEATDLATVRFTHYGCIAGACGRLQMPDRCLRLDLEPLPGFSADDWAAAPEPTPPAFQRIDDCTVQLVDPVTQAPRGLPLRHPEPVDDEDLIASPTGRLVLSKGYDFKLRLWDGMTGRLLCPSFCDGRMWEAARFSRDGRRVLARHYEDEKNDCRDIVWELDRVLTALDGPPVPKATLDWAERVVGVRFSPSGELETLPPPEQRAVLDLPVPAEMGGLRLAPRQIRE